jgi:hypothetical protein
MAEPPMAIALDERVVHQRLAPSLRDPRVGRAIANLQEETHLGIVAEHNRLLTIDRSGRPQRSS